MDEDKHDDLAGLGWHLAILAVMVGTYWIAAIIFWLLWPGAID